LFPPLDEHWDIRSKRDLDYSTIVLFVKGFLSQFRRNSSNQRAGMDSAFNLSGARGHFQMFCYLSDIKVPFFITLIHA